MREHVVVINNSMPFAKIGVDVRIFAERLREARLLKGLTQQQLADELGIERATYTTYESDRRQPSLDKVVELARLLNCSTDYLLGRTDSPELQKKELTIDGQPVEVEIDINRPELQNPSHLEELVRKMIDQALAERERNRDL